MRPLCAPPPKGKPSRLYVRYSRLAVCRPGLFLEMSGLSGQNYTDRFVRDFNARLSIECEIAFRIRSPAWGVRVP